jgi:sortase (surface protein transpeptidase)
VQGQHRSRFANVVVANTAMTPEAPREGARARRHQWVWWSVAGVALAVAIVAFAGTLTTRDPKVLVLSHTVSASKPTPKAVPKAVVKAKALTIARSRPLTLIIPSLKINTAVGTLGLQADHQVMVPTNARVVDWYIDGPTPGEIGSSVILGHVDSYKGPGTFFYLKSLKAGNAITVKLADGVVTHFTVVKVVQYSKNSFPDRLVYGSHGTRMLQLVTCGGTFDHATGHYESNIVVFSRLESSSAPTR